MKPMKVIKVVGFKDRKSFNEVFSKEVENIDTVNENKRFRNMNEERNVIDKAFTSILYKLK